MLFNKLQNLFPEEVSLETKRAENKRTKVYNYEGSPFCCSLVLVKKYKKIKQSNLFLRTPLYRIPYLPNPSEMFFHRQTLEKKLYIRTLNQIRFLYLVLHIFGNFGESVAGRQTKPIDESISWSCTGFFGSSLALFHPH